MFNYTLITFDCEAGYLAQEYSQVKISQPINTAVTKALRAFFGPSNVEFELLSVPVAFGGSPWHDSLARFMQIQRETQQVAVAIHTCGVGVSQMYLLSMEKMQEKHQFEEYSHYWALKKVDL